MIRAREIRVLDDEKKQIGVLSVPEALAIARERGLDLVEIAPAANPPVCRIMDYGKFLYELHKKEHEAKKHQKQVLVKEIKLRPKISIHDYTFKTKHILRFLEEGNKVKVTIMLRGREKSRPDLGIQVLERVKETVKAFGKQDGGVRRQDWAVSTLLIPVKTGTGGRDAKAKNPPGSPQALQGDGEKKDTPLEGV
ncbi:MAG: translation initiation factor IF-3 [Candidatus Aminicenantes bacterium]|nr:translation initiation factor IF-3 [Candidatus Aminicenantes bacterium]